MAIQYLEVDENGLAVGGIYDGNPGIIIKSNWVELVDDAGVGWSWDGTNWTPPEDTRSYSEKRLVAYPSLQDQADMQYHDVVDGTTTWQDAIKAVKDAYPKE
jgi:lipoprotein-anchoring transpeptidase ErfK/SrfK